MIYELHVGTFSEAGTFQGATGRLAELVDLGVNAVELMPIVAFPGSRNWGSDFSSTACIARENGPVS